MRLVAMAAISPYPTDSPAVPAEVVVVAVKAEEEAERVEWEAARGAAVAAAAVYLPVGVMAETAVPVASEVPAETAVPVAAAAAVVEAAVPLSFSPLVSLLLTEVSLRMGQRAKTAQRVHWADPALPVSVGHRGNRAETLLRQANQDTAATAAMVAMAAAAAAGEMEVPAATADPALAEPLN